MSPGYFRDTAVVGEARSDSSSASSENSASVEQQKIETRKRIEDNYFAAANPDMIASVLMDKVSDWINYVEGTAHWKRIKKSNAMYYGWTDVVGANSSQIVQSGPQGQFSLAFINEFRNTIKHVLNMITAQKVKGDCHGANTDVETTESCELGNAILEQVILEKDVGSALKQSCEYACFLSEGHIALGWDHWKGSPYTVDEIGQPVFDGDITLTNYAPWNVIKDHWRRDAKLPWVILIDWENKYDLAAKYPDKADAIIDANPSNIWKYQEGFCNQYLFSDTDLIPVLQFRHERSPALPNGRLVKFLDNTTKLFDGDLPYPSIQVYRMAPDHLAESPHGYTFAFDLLSVQDLSNLVDSIAATIFRTFGVGVVKLPQGHNMDYTQLAQGLMAMVVNEKNGKVEAMNFAQLPPGLFDWRGWLSSRGDILAGINSVIKGVPDQNIKSGNFAALVAAQAYQFSNQLQESYQVASQKVLQGVIEMYQTFANTKRVVKMIGKNKEYMMKSFRKEDLQAVSTVTVDMGNPATSTTAMKMQMGEDLLASGKIDTAKQFLNVMETGKLEHVTEPAETEQNNIDRENEELRKGMNPPSLKTDNPMVHILKHLTLLDDPVIRSTRPEVIQAVDQHIKQHVEYWKMITFMEPEMLLLKNIPPCPMGGPMGMPPPGGAQPPPPGGAPTMGPAPEGAMPQLPGLPKDALRGEPPPVAPQPIAQMPM